MILPLALLLSLCSQDKKQAFTDPAQAGPDFQVQGEYEGEVSGKGKFGAQVVALGGGKFDATLLEGGLPGAGWNQKAKIKLTGTTSLAGEGWTGEIAEGKLKGTGPESAAFTLSKVMRKSPAEGANPPAGAIVLFDGSSADEWNGGKLIEGNLLNMGITSKKKFKDVKLHVEFRLSFMPFGRGQGRSNSGVYLAGRHEVQVLDSFGLKGENNECGGIYTISKPLVNMCYPPLSWQTYDIEYRLATADHGALMTVHHNGVLIQEKIEIKKKTTAAPDKGGDAEPGPIHLQNHGDPLAYRNIWVVELK